MNNRLYKVVIGISFGLVVFASLRFKNSLNLTPKSPLETYFSQIKDQEQALWVGLQDLGINFDQFTALKDEALKKPQKALTNPKKVSPSTHNLAVGVIKDFDLNPDEITIISDSLPAEACMENNVLHINEEKLLKLPESAQKFVIGHELQHFIHRDDIDPDVLDQMALTLPEKPRQEENAITRYYRFGEWRADLLCALKNKDYAGGYLSYAQTVMDIYGESNGRLHPKNSERLKLAHEIHQSMIERA